MIRQTFSDIDAIWSTRLRIAEQPGWLRTITAILAHSGDSWLWIFGLAVTWWRGDTQIKVWVLRLLGMILATALLVMIIKFSVQRRRPEGEWGSIYRNTDPHSFPSGHAARAALLAVLTISWGPYWLGILVLLWAPFVSIARVAMGLHYLSDVLVGAALGVISGLLGCFIFN